MKEDKETPEQEETEKPKFSSKRKRAIKRYENVWGNKR